MPSRELVSVIVPAYNHARYVSECIGALADQTHQRLELLVADDASTDDTAECVAEALRRHGDRFERVRFTRHERNLGTAGTLNALLPAARGRYVYLNASDDRSAPEAIATLAEILDRHPRTAMAVGDARVIDAHGDPVLWGPRQVVARPGDAEAYGTFAAYFRATIRPDLFEPRVFGRLDTLDRANYVPNGKLFRRSALESAGGWETGMLEDWAMNFRLARRHRLRYVDRVLFAYRWHDSNTIRDSARVARLDAATRRWIDGQLRHPLVWVRVKARRGIGRRWRDAVRRLGR